MSAALLIPCGLPGCWAIYEQTQGAGRPRRYCSDEHRREAETMRKRTVARLTRLRDQVRRDEHLLAALGGDPDADVDDTTEDGTR
jgi:hypothetical protein